MNSVNGTRGVRGGTNMNGTRLLTAVLTRGRSRRTGTDKAFLLWQDRPLIEHSLLTATGLPGDTVIVTKRPDVYEKLGVEIFPDRFDVETPISGIMTAGAVAEDRGYDWFLVTGADTIPIIDNLFQMMWMKAMDGESAGARAVLLEVNGRVQPLPGIYHRSSIPIWNAAYRQEKYHLTPIAESIPSLLLAFNEAPFLNINTRGQLSAFEQSTA